jgi:hypothetical protein
MLPLGWAQRAAPLHAFWGGTLSMMATGFATNHHRRGHGARARCCVPLRIITIFVLAAPRTGFRHEPGTRSVMPTVPPVHRLPVVAHPSATCQKDCATKYHSVSSHSLAKGVWGTGFCPPRGGSPEGGACPYPLVPFAIFTTQPSKTDKILTDALSYS